MSRKLTEQKIERLLDDLSKMVAFAFCLRSSAHGGQERAEVRRDYLGDRRIGQFIGLSGWGRRVVSEEPSRQL